MASPHSSEVCRSDFGESQEVGSQACFLQASSGAPAALHTGRGHISASAASQPKKRGTVSLIIGQAAKPCSWRGLVRIALVRLVVADEPANTEPAPLAETLTLDAGKLSPLLWNADGTESEHCYSQLTA